MNSMAPSTQDVFWIKQCPALVAPLQARKEYAAKG
jgi:hypothetical protein